MRSASLNGVRSRGDIVGDVIAAEADHRRVLDRAVVIDSDVGGAAADVDQHHAELALFVGKHGFGRGQRRQHHLGDVEAGAVAALDDILRRGRGAGHDMNLGFEAHAGHAERLANAVLVVDDVVLRQHVDHVAVHQVATARAASITRSRSRCVTSLFSPPRCRGC